MTKSSTITSDLEAILQADLIRDEGFKTRPYRDHLGNLTIGVGHNLQASGLCNEAILAQLRFDLLQVIDDLNRSIPWWKEHPEATMRVLVNLGFNLGIQTLLTFKRTLEAIRTRNYALAADHLMDSLYASQVPSRASRLAKLLRSMI